VREYAEAIEALCDEMDEAEENEEAGKRCGEVMKLLGKLGKLVHGNHTVRFHALLAASASFINAGCSRGPNSSSTLTLIMEVVSVLRKAPYDASIDLAYQLAVVGKVVLSIARDPATSTEQRDMCLKQALQSYGDAFKLLLTSRGMDHPQTKIMQARMKQVKEMRAVSKKTGLIQAILDKKKAREQAETPAHVDTQEPETCNSTAFKPTGDGGVGLATPASE